jgi:hypothetical protein
MVVTRAPRRQSLSCSCSDVRRRTVQGVAPDWPGAVEPHARDVQGVRALSDVRPSRPPASRSVDTVLEEKGLLAEPVPRAESALLKNSTPYNEAGGCRAVDGGLRDPSYRCLRSCRAPDLFFKEDNEDPPTWLFNKGYGKDHPLVIKASRRSSTHRCLCG